MKIYAKQVSPEYQESPLFWGDWPENVITDGNRHYNSHTTKEYEHVARYLEEMAGAWEEDAFYYGYENGRYIKRPKKREYTITETLKEYGFCRNDGKPWNNKEKHKWRVILEGDERDDDNAICAALELITGIEFDYATIRGCYQGDWQDIYFPAEYGPEWLEEFEAEYFNTGTEWIIDPDGDAFSIYITEWRDDDIRARIADAAGISADNVILIDYNGEEIAA